MPQVSVWMIRCSLVWFAFSFLTGSIMLLEKAYMVDARIWAVMPFHIEGAMLGWMVQFVLGVAWWIYPKFLTGPARGSNGLGWAVLLGVNIATVLSIVGAVQPELKVVGRLILLIFILAILPVFWRRLGRNR